MQILLCAGLELGKLRSKFNKVCAAIERDDFRSVDMKKLAPTVYYRAKLDDASCGCTSKTATTCLPSSAARAAAWASWAALTAT